jgi:excisionase family DNA binding protein
VANEQFFSFDEALDELRLKEEELKRLVSEGEIRAFREGETMKLRRTDVEALRSELSGGEVVDLGDVADDLVFEDDGDFGSAGMATEELSEADTLLEDDVEDVGEIDLDEDVDDLDEGPAGGSPVRRTSTALAPAEADEGEEIWVRAMMLATTAVLVLAMPVCLAAGSGELTGLARSIAGIFTELPPQ